MQGGGPQRVLAQQEPLFDSRGTIHPQKAEVTRPRGVKARISPFARMNRRLLIRGNRDDVSE